MLNIKHVGARGWRLRVINSCAQTGKMLKHKVNVLSAKLWRCHSAGYMNTHLLQWCK